MQVIMKGIDVSEHQGVIDWQSVKKSGLVDFAMIRAGYGQGNRERQAIRNIEGALSVGLHVGIYWFCYALDPAEAIKEAEECLRLLEPYKGKVTFPICYDLEASGYTKPGAQGSEEYATYMGRPYTKKMRTEIAKAFLNRVEEEGYYAMLYANWDYLENRYVPGSMGRFDLWLASPGVDPYRKCGIWQYSWHGEIPGIVGEVDLNYAFYDYPALIKANGLNGFKKIVDQESTPSETKKEYLVEIPFETEEDRERFLSAIGRARKVTRTLTPEKMRAKR